MKAVPVWVEDTYCLSMSEAAREAGRRIKGVVSPGKIIQALREGFEIGGLRIAETKPPPRPKPPPQPKPAVLSTMDIIVKDFQPSGYEQGALTRTPFLSLGLVHWK